MEKELYRKLDKDCGKKLIYKMAQERDEDSKDVNTGSVIKDKNGKLVTDRKDVFKGLGGVFLGAAERENSELELPSAVEGQVKLEEIGDAQVGGSVADSEADLQERLVDWKEIFGKHGLRLSLEKMEVLWIRQQKKTLT